MSGKLSSLHLMQVVRLSFIGLVVLQFAARLAAEDAPPESAEENARKESLSSWQYYQELPLPASTDARWFDVILTPSVFDAARPDLADLRLYDAADVEAPYALRILEPKLLREAIPTQEYNRSQGTDKEQQLSLDLGSDAPEHNEVEVRTAGEQFRRRAILEGSDDQEKWQTLAEKNLLHFQAAGEELKDDTFSYPPSRFRYLKIRVFPDPQVDEEAVFIFQAIPYRHVEVAGENVTRPAVVGPRQPVRADGQDGSAWILDLGGREVPCRKIEVDVSNPEFDRDYYLEAGGSEGSDEPFHHIHYGTWQRKSGEEAKPLVAEFDEVRAARLRLTVVDSRNPPLKVSAATYTAAARQVVFAAAASLRSPVRMYFGNPEATGPQYDFARGLPDRLEPAPERLELGPRQDNPAYSPPPLPLTERWPWLIYVVLGAALAVLGLLILSLGRAAVRAHDAREVAGAT